MNLESVFIDGTLEAHLELEFGDQCTIDASVVEHGDHHLQLGGHRLRVQILRVRVLELLVRRLVVKGLQGDGHARSAHGVFEML